MRSFPPRWLGDLLPWVLAVGLSTTGCEASRDNAADADPLGSFSQPLDPVVRARVFTLAETVANGELDQAVRLFDPKHYEFQLRIHYAPKYNDGTHRPVDWGELNAEYLAEALGLHGLSGGARGIRRLEYRSVEPVKGIPEALRMRVRAHLRDGTTRDGWHPPGGVLVL